MRGSLQNYSVEGKARRNFFDEYLVSWDKIEAMIPIEESIREEEDVGPAYLDEDAYVTEIIIGGVILKVEIVSCKLAELEEKAERSSEEEAIRAMKALKVLDDEQDEVIFDTGCTAHVLKSGEGLLDLRKAPEGSCIKGVGGTATITHVGKILGLGRVFVAQEGANLISVSQLAEAEASFGRSRACLGCECFFEFVLPGPRHSLNFVPRV